MHKRYRDLLEGYVQRNPTKADVESRTLSIGRKVRFNSNHPEHKHKTGTITGIDHSEHGTQNFKVKLHHSGAEVSVRSRHIHVKRDTSKIGYGDSAKKKKKLTDAEWRERHP